MKAARPNILMITCHDLGRFLGCYGWKTVHSPHLDALAGDGLRFSHAFCAAPQCSPSRAALFTGRFPHANGVMGLTHADFGWDLHSSERHLGQILKDAGYNTALVGVHHEVRGRDPNVLETRLGMRIERTKGTAAEITDAAADTLARLSRAGGPFYLQVGYTEPHRLRSERDAPNTMGFRGDHIEADGSCGVSVPPYLADTPLAREEIAELQGAVRYLDGEVGRLLNVLKREGAEGNTLVIFTTDHGLALPRAKCSLYDPGLETALVVRYPSRGWTGGRTIDHLVSNVDIVPTILDLLGDDGESGIQGQSLLSLVEGGSQNPRTCIYGELTYHKYYDPKRCIRTHRYKLIVNFTVAPSFMDTSQSWRPRTETRVPKEPAISPSPLVELYEIERDPNEWRNMADDPDCVETRTNLLQELYSWMRETHDPLLRGAISPPRHRDAMRLLSGAVEQNEAQGGR